MALTSLFYRNTGTAKKTKAGRLGGGPAMFFLYHHREGVFLGGVKYLSILIVGLALATSGVADDKAEIERLKKEIEVLKAKQELIQLRQELAELKKGPTVNNDQIKYIDGIPYLKGEKEPFTGTSIGYREDGSKYGEIPFVDGKEHGTVIWYRKDGSKKEGAVFENGKIISSKRY